MRAVENVKIEIRTLVSLCLVMMTASAGAATSSWVGTTNNGGYGGTDWAPFEVLANWEGGFPNNPTGDDTVLINNQFGYVCVYDYDNMITNASAYPVTDPFYIGKSIKVGSDRFDGEWDGTLIVNSGKVQFDYLYLGHEYVNKNGYCEVNNDATLAASRNVYIGGYTDNANPLKNRGNGALILNDNATGTDKGRYSYFTKVGGDTGEYSEGEGLLQLNDNSEYKANALFVYGRGRVEVNDNGLLTVNGGLDDTSQDDELQALIDAGQLLADGGAGKVIVTVTNPEYGTTTAVASPRSGGADMTPWDYQPADSETITPGSNNVVTLRWVSGYKAAADVLLITNKVYLSDVETDVVNREPGALVDTLSREQALGVSNLVPGTTYYWAADTVFDDASVGSGPVSSFQFGDNFSAAFISAEVSGANQLKLTLSTSGGVMADHHLAGCDSLVDGDWAGVPQSDDGVNPFVETNLTYSTLDGTNTVVYVQTTNSVLFYAVD